MVYSFFSQLLSDKKDGVIFTCFGVWHLTWIILTAIVAFLIVVFIKSNEQKKKNDTTKNIINIAFGLYIADFFLMPFAYGEIDIEKLPFHICTATCVLCFISRHTKVLGAYRTHIALLAFISNLVYLIYPAGVMWHSVNPLSYRVIQTLLFHALMTIYGFLVLVFDDKKIEWKRCYRDLVLLGAVTVWAILGNAFYNGKSGEYNHFFNWFFVVRDPFYLFPANVAPYVMPFVNIALFFIVECVIYLIFYAVKKLKSVKSGKCVL